jgi:uncharacterized membrane protein
MNLPLTMALLLFAVTALVLIRYVPQMHAETKRREKMSAAEIRDDGWHHR